MTTSNELSNEIWLRLSKAIESRQSMAVELIQEMVKRPSHEKEWEVQQYISNWFGKRGIKTDLWEPDIHELRKHPAFVPVEYDYSGRPNQVVMLTGKGGGRSLSLNGHVDVVPVDPAIWKHGGPWSGTHEDGRVYGRGSVDMKGGIAAGMIILDALRSEEIKLKGDLQMQFVVDEENGGNGTLAALMRGYRSDATIFLEPTSPDYMVVSSRGAQFFRIILPGKEAGIEYQFTTPNVIEKAARMFGAVQSYAIWRNSQATHPLYEWDPTKIPASVCKIRAGSWPSTLPSQCIMEGSLECLPGEDIQEVKEGFKSFLLKTAEQDAWLMENPPQIEWFGLWFEASETPLDHPFLKQFIHTYQGVFNKIPGIVGGGGSDLRIPILYGSSPSILFGPSGGAIHSTDEYVEVESVMRVAQIIAKFILDWCQLEN